MKALAPGVGAVRPALSRDSWAWRTGRCLHSVWPSAAPQAPVLLRAMLVWGRHGDDTLWFPRASHSEDGHSSPRAGRRPGGGEAPSLSGLQVRLCVPSFAAPRARGQEAGLHSAGFRSASPAVHSGFPVRFRGGRGQQGAGRRAFQPSVGVHVQEGQGVSAQRVHARAGGRSLCPVCACTCRGDRAFQPSTCVHVPGGRRVILACACTCRGDRACQPSVCVQVQEGGGVSAQRVRAREGEEAEAGLDNV